MTKRSSTSPGSTSSRLQVNPSSVPVEDGLGLEGIFYQSEVDLMIVRGNGRVGAAISPSNSESTFFGPPSIELSPDYLQRRVEAKKYKSLKYTLATAVSLFDNKKSGLSKFSLRLGLMAKYNKDTSATSPGGGIAGSLGPLSFSYSYYKDETLLNYEQTFGSTLPNEVFRYNVETYGVGLYLNSLILDYSRLKLKEDKLVDPFLIDLYTATLTMRRLILTAAYRVENSTAYAYNAETKSLEPKQIKSTYFGGVQFTINKNVMVGVLYNYYLLDEFSGALTLFF